MAPFERFQTILNEYARRIKQPFILKDVYFFWFLGTLIVLLSSHFFYIALFLKKLPQTIILHQNLYFGIDRIGVWFSIFFFPLMQLLISSFNSVIAASIFNTERMLSYMLMVGAIIVSVIIFIGGVVVVRSNV